MRIAPWLLFVASCGFSAPGGESSTDGADSAMPDSQVVDGDVLDSPTVVDTPPGVDADTRRWWDMRWTKRTPITVTSVTAPITKDLQVVAHLSVDNSECVGSPPESLRIVDDDGVAAPHEIARFIDAITLTELDIWFRVQAALASNETQHRYWLYCGFPTAGLPVQGPSDVFDDWDSFESATLDTTRWTPSSANVRPTNGEVDVAGDSSFVSKTKYANNIAIDFSASRANLNRGDYLLGSSPVTGGPWFVWWAVQDNGQIEPDWNDSSSSSTGNVIGSASRAFSLDSQVVGVDRFDGHTLYRLQNAVIADDPHSSTAMLPALAQNLGGGGGANVLSVQWYRVRKTVFPLPMVTVSTAFETY